MTRRKGLLVGGVIAGVGLVIGLAIAVVGGIRVGGLDGLVPDLRPIEADGSYQSVRMEPGLEWVVFVETSELSGTPGVACDDSTGVSAQEPSTDLVLTLGRKEWTRALVLTVDSPGTYDVACVAEDVPGWAPELAMQEAVEPGAAGRLFTGIVAIVIGIGVIALGLLVGGVIALVAAVQGRRQAT